MKKVRKLLPMTVMLLVLIPAAVRGQSALDGFDPNANGNVFVVVVQPDGRILIGGDFTTLSPNGGVAVTRNNIARLNTDGTLDTGFDPDASDVVDSIAVQADGKILVGGIFTSIGGQTRSRIARLDATTGLADSFDPNANNSVQAVAVQADGKILVGGNFTSIGEQPRNHIARLDATTGLADSFDPNANGQIFSMALQSDGKILVAGSFNGTNSIGGQTRNHIARLDRKTGLADAFNPNADGNVTSIALQADGKVVAGGEFLAIGGDIRQHVARLDPTTGLADSFDPNANNTVESIAVQADGKILAGGNFTSIGGQTRNFIARLDPTTGLADSFDPNANNQVLSIAVQADGKILAGGAFTTLSPNGGAAVTRNNIARLETDGRLDQTLNLSIIAPTLPAIGATAVQPDGKILIGGAFTTVLGVARNNIARLNTDGTLDTVFDPNANSAVFSIVLQPDGKILVGGNFNGVSSIGGQTRNYIARLDATTGLADSFDPNAGGVTAISGVLSIAVQADGKILAGGDFTSIGGQPRNFIARLDPTTGLADSFNPNADNGLASIAVQADGKILAGGIFQNIGGQTRSRIARLDAVTGLADSFDPNANHPVNSIVVQADGKILVGGGFTTIGGQTRNRFARLDPTTGSADSFDPNASGQAGMAQPAVLSIAVQADGKILAGGNFLTIGGHTRNYIARLDPTTGLADSFDPNANDAVFSIAAQADGKILAGGQFTSVSGQSRNLFARLSNDTAALQNLAVTQTTITWTRSGSSPQFARVTFEYSTDNVSYTPLGNGTASGSNWILTGLSLSTGQNIYIRARGYYRCGGSNDSESVAESVRYGPAAIPTPTPTPTPATPTPTPTPTATATAGGGTPSPTATAGGGSPAQALNFSTRLHVLTDADVGIGGLIITGTQPKQVVLRGIGPSLSGVGVPNPLADPVLELHGPSGFTTITNDNWMDSPDAQQIQALGLAPTNNLESAILATLSPGLYTGILKGTNNGVGVGLVEAYDVSQAADSKLANISTRGFVDTGGDIMIAGFILGGNTGQDTIVVRGIGPSLSTFGIPNVLANPQLELRNSSGTLIRADDDWMDDPTQAALIMAAGLAPTNNFESAIYETLSPGQYTALLSGVNNGTGVGLVEAYDLAASGLAPSPTPQATPTPSPTCEPYRVLIAASEEGRAPTTLRTQILAEPGVAVCDLFDASTGTPTLAQLQAYDVVVPFSDYPYSDAVAMGDVLADYADANGVVVEFDFDWINGPNGLGGRWIFDGYTPFNPNAFAGLFTDSTLGAFTAGHPLMQGVTSLNGHFRLRVTLATGATQVAAWADNLPMIAVQTQAGPTAVGINNYVGDNPNLWSGQFGRVVVNAARWLKPVLCNTPTPTPTPTPRPATLETYRLGYR